MTVPVTHEAIMERLEAGNSRFARLEEQHGQIISQQAVILEQLRPLPQMMADLKVNNETTLAIKDVVDALATIKNIGRFAKWVAAPAAMVMALVSMIWAIAAWGKLALTAMLRALGGH